MTNASPGVITISWDPVANIVAGIKYIQERYGQLLNIQQSRPGFMPMNYQRGLMETIGDTFETYQGEDDSEPRPGTPESE